MTFCIICLEPIDTSKNYYSVSQCNHLFHFDCLSIVDKKNNHRCPCCDNYLEEQDNLDIESIKIYDLDEYNYEQVPLDIYNLLDIVLIKLNESELKNNIIEIKSLLDAGLKDNILDDIDNYLDNYSELCYKYGCEYPIDLALIKYLIGIKNYLSHLQN